MRATTCCRKRLVDSQQLSKVWPMKKKKKKKKFKLRPPLAAVKVVLWETLSLSGPKAEKNWTRRLSLPDVRLLVVIAKVLDTIVKLVRLGRRKKGLTRATKMMNETLTLTLQFKHLQRDHVVTANNLVTILKHVMLGKRRKMLRRQKKMLREETLILLQLQHQQREPFIVVSAEKQDTHIVNAKTKTEKGCHLTHLRSESLLWWYKCLIHCTLCSLLGFHCTSPESLPVYEYFLCSKGRLICNNCISYRVTHWWTQLQKFSKTST